MPYLSDKDRAARVEQIAKAVAPLMGEGWTALDKHAGGTWDNSRFVLSHQFGPEVDIYFDNQNNHETGRFRGSVPGGRDNLRMGQTIPEINVSFARPAKAIAAEIARRLLPLYLPLYAKVMEHIAAHAEHQDKCIHNLLTLERTFCEGAINIANGQHALNIYHTGEGYATITAYAAQADFDLRNLPLPLALEIAKVWKNYFEKN
jgi:hypothetical protein